LRNDLQQANDITSFLAKRPHQCSLKAATVLLRPFVLYAEEGSEGRVRNHGKTVEFVWNYCGMRETEKEQVSLVVTFGGYRLDLRAGQLWRGSQVVKLTPKAFEMLCYFVGCPGQLVTKDDLLATVWPQAVVGSATLASCIQTLRKALRDKAKTPRYIETVPRRGYRFIAPLTTTPPILSSEFQVPRSLPPPIPSLQSSAPTLVEREAELAQLHGWLRKALDGERQIVFVTGEPGIGKTTLVEAFLHSLKSRGQHQVSEDHKYVLSEGQPLDPRCQTLDISPWIGQGQCIEHYGAGEPYLPLLEALGRLCRQPNGEQIVALLAQYAPIWLVQMPALVSTEEFGALQRKTVGATRERMLRELAEVLEILTAERLLVLWLEDLHWGDGATLDWLAFIARRRERAKLLVLGAYRPVEVSMTEHPLRAIKQELQLHGQCEELPLIGLSEEAVREYLAMRVHHITASARDIEQSPNHVHEGVERQRQRETGSKKNRLRADVPGSDSDTDLRGIAQRLHRRTDGNPLFFVNVVDTLIAQNVISIVDGQWVIQKDVEQTATVVPENLRQLIERQYERLPPEAQRVLEVASVAGAGFSAAAVAAGVATTVEAVEEQCGELARQDHFLRLSGAHEWPDETVAARYSFRHALYQEALYERLSVGRRQRLHQQIGERIEQGYGDQVREIAAELAMHFERGRAYAKAVHYHHEASENAVRRNAQQEAIKHISTGLVLFDMLPDTPERTQQELTLQVTLGELLTTVKGFGVPEVAQAFARALELCRQPTETPQLFRALLGLWTFYVERAELATAHELAARLLRLSQNVQSKGFFVWAHLSLGITSHFQGDQMGARHHLEQSLAFYDPSRFRALSSQYDPSVLSLSTLGPVLWLLGYPEQAWQRSKEALTLSREFPHPYNLVYALNLASRVCWLQGKQEAVQKVQEELVAFSQEQGFTSYLALGKVLGGWIVAEQGNREEGLSQMRQNLVAWRATGAESARPYYLALLAEVYRTVGQPEEGRRVVDEGLAEGVNTGGRFFEAELYRLKGEFTLAQSSVQSLESRIKEAEECFLKASKIARHQQAKSPELRAVMSLARLWQRQGKQKEAYEMLAETYGWFTEGLDTADLQDAKALLEELS
jgi:predicted ATPase/DNA-binding winged helix-turn-helix (wHTH) protein